jgi:predicted RNA-binding Zn ribbon-like protein
MFVNSDDMELGTDQYATVEDMTRWLRDAELLGARERATEADRRAAVELRAALRELLLANHDRRDAGDRERAALAVVERAGRAAGLEARFSEGLDARLEPRAKGVAGALGRVVAVVHGAMRDGTWERMKACRNDECQWAFYDHSRNRSGAWCQMETCGTQAKMRTYRQRQKP